MYKYIVTWVLTTIVPEPCPDANMVGEFGEVSYSVSCAVYHTSSFSDTHTKKFDDREKAFIFYNKGKQKEVTGWYGAGSNITGIKIDSVLNIEK